MFSNLRHKKLKFYAFPLLLMFSILLGALASHFLGSSAKQLKPLGDIFINLMLTIVIPLIFFSVASAIANMGDLKQTGKIAFYTVVVFILTGIIAATFMIVVVKIFPPIQNINFSVATKQITNSNNVIKQIVDIFTVSDFTQIFSREHILALILFAVLIGLSTSFLGERGRTFSVFLGTANEILTKAVSLVMYYAPIGFFAYFAVLTAELGPDLLKNYFWVVAIYCISCIFYFICIFTIYAWWAGGRHAIEAFWKNAPLPIVTSLATCSSVASIPISLKTSKLMGVPASIYETIIPLGAVLHKDGSVLAGVVKIAFLFAVFHLDFSGFFVLLTAIMVSMLVGTVMGAIPSGGMTAELLILSLYGFPPEALIIAVTITMLLDAPATLLNVNSNNICSMLVARLIKGKNWFKEQTTIQ